jgi:cation:H+ antiporter
VSLTVALIVLVVCFAVLAKCADWFVDGAVGIAEHFAIPKMLVGIVLVSMATTAPELAVSVMSALDDSPEIALGNAIGSVIADDTLAIGLASLVSTAPIAVNPSLLKTTGLFLIAVDLIAYWLVWDGVLSRGEGIFLLFLFFVYLVFTYITQKKQGITTGSGELAEIEQGIAGQSLSSLVLLFLLGLAGVLVASDFIVEAAKAIATAFGISAGMIGLTVIAIGTSLPEIATGVTAGRRGHGEIVVGNILGADILNVCWIAGASAALNPLVVGPKEIHFMMPTMLVVVLTMLIMMRTGFRLNKIEGGILVAFYAVYLGLAVRFLL